MGYMNVSFIVRNDVVFVLNTSNENMKLKMGLLHLVEHKELQTSAILLHDKKIMMLLETSLVCTTLHIVVFEDLELLYRPLHFNTLLLYDF